MEDYVLKRVGDLTFPDKDILIHEDDDDKFLIIQYPIKDGESKYPLEDLHAVAKFFEERVTKNLIMIPEDYNVNYYGYNTAYKALKELLKHMKEKYNIIDYDDERIDDGR